MSTPATVKAQLRLLLNNANEVTKAEDATLTEANETLIAGYGQSQGGSSGGSSSGSSGSGSGSNVVLRELTVRENGIYEPDSTCDGFCKVIVNVSSGSSGDSGSQDMVIPFVGFVKDLITYTRVYGEILFDDIILEGEVL